MTWNWQQTDWPAFTWNEARLAKAENRFLREAGVLLGAARYLGNDMRDQFMVETLQNEALTTSAIEGEILDRDSVQSSIRRQFGLATDSRRVRPAEQGIAELTVAVYRTFGERLTHQTLFAGHRLLMNGRGDLDNIGGYRTGEEPMQIVSGPLQAPKVHFEAPPSSAVPAEMDRFLDWFDRAGPAGDAPLPALTRAGVAHLWFISIHPFEDGNGRLARAIVEKALAQGLGQPSLSALSATILRRRPGYYAALEAANKHNEITDWLAWFASVALEAQRRALVQVEFLIEKTRLLDRLRGTLNERQEKALLRLLAAGPDGFIGGLSAGNYATITGASPATATRDLADLVAKEGLVKEGERRYARYQVAIPLRAVAPVIIGVDGEIVDSTENS